MINVPELFGSMVFGDAQMKARLPKDVYESLHNTIEEGKDLDIEVANAVADAMKDWAIEKGATHYTHWFQPMTGVTAEKHDSFITPVADGSVIMDFSGKALIKGEPDASSFPSGGLRATFEARGYTAWDPTSYAFVKDDALCIPTAFYSYSGQILDKKTPLLRSMEVINEKATELMHFFGHNDVTTVKATVGAEQEYFLIDKELFNEREDLILTGRTLFGAPPPKGQELDDHYFGAIKPRVMEFMEELNNELWKLGIVSKTEHNEVAPSQHEMAPLFVSANTAADQNQLTMEIMKKVADRLGLACLLHEKPFAGVNGSGKHNNWSLQTNTGINLLKPGKKPEHNNEFLVMLAAVIGAVDDHQGLIRACISSAGNDHRLGADEAPPAIISMFIGDDMSAVLEAVANGEKYESETSRMKTGVHVLPDFKKDNADRNRTSPIAFTGNKFEFRMPGSSDSIAELNTVINTAVADKLDGIIKKLKEGATVSDIVRHAVEKHGHIIFNGNNYSQEWIAEAEERGLLNLRTSAEAIPYYAAQSSIDLFVKHKIFTEEEVVSRCEILLETYKKQIKIEALTMKDMVLKDILPAAFEYQKDLSMVRSNATAMIFNKVAVQTDRLLAGVDRLQAAINMAEASPDTKSKALCYGAEVVAAMKDIRFNADLLEEIVGRGYWPFPAYSDLLFSL